MTNDDGIFLIAGDTPIVLRQRAYESEELLQDLLGRFPEVLAGGTTTSEDVRRRLLLIRREMGVPKAESAANTWSLDHLFVADDGVPVVVEVKRSSDTRIRREVVGQMLDYAANGVRYWPIADLRAALERTASAAGRSGDELVREAFGEVDVEELWLRVESNLRSGRIRMVFVADALPAELIRIIEFLNEQMSPAEVLGVEVPQYLADGHQVLVPRVVGRTSSAVAAKETGPRTQWDEQSFLDAAAARGGDAHAAFFARLFRHNREAGTKINWGRGASPGASGWYSVAGTPIPIWNANVGAGSRGPYLYLYLPEIKRRLDPTRFEQVVGALRDTVPPYRPRLEEARATDYTSTYPSAFVADIVDHLEALVAVVSSIVDASPESR